MIHPTDLANILKGALEKKIGSVMESKALERRAKVIASANEWKKDAIGWLSRTSTLMRRKESSDIKIPGPYDFPFRIKGNIARSVHYKVEKLVYNKNRKVWSFTVKNWFSRVASYGKGQAQVVDYSVILNNTEGKYYSNYKQRLVDKLHTRIKQIIR